MATQQQEWRDQFQKAVEKIEDRERSHGAAGTLQFVGDGSRVRPNTPVTFVLGIDEALEREESRKRGWHPTKARAFFTRFVQTKHITKGRFKKGFVVVGLSFDRYRAYRHEDATYPDGERLETLRVELVRKAEEMRTEQLLKAAQVFQGRTFFDSVDEAREALKASLIVQDAAERLIGKRDDAEAAGAHVTNPRRRAQRLR